MFADLPLTCPSLQMIDEVHTLIGAGAAEGAIDAANILKPALARGELQVSQPVSLQPGSGARNTEPAVDQLARKQG